MKKIFFMLVSFLCLAFAAQAQTVTDLSQLSNDKVYTLRSARAFLFYSDKVPGEICGSTGKAVGTVTRNNSDPAQLFRIEKNGSNYYLYSVHRGTAPPLLHAGGLPSGRRVPCAALLWG